MNKDLPPDEDQPDETLPTLIARMDKTRAKRQEKAKKKIDKLEKKKKQ